MIGADTFGYRFIDGYSKLFHRPTATPLLYSIRHIPSGSTYVGVSCNPKTRIHYHKKWNYPVGVALKSYPPSEFSISILMQGPRDFCYEMEIKLIDKLRALVGHGGYNIDGGGNKPPVLRGPKNPNFGKRLTEERKEQIRKSRAAQVFSPEVNMKRGLAHRGERNCNAKMNAESVLALRRKHSLGESCCALGKFYGISATTAWCIVTRKTWDHVL